MDERLRALLDSAAGSTAAKAAATYYVVAAVGLYRIFGRLSGPNPKLQNVALRDLDGASSSLVAGSGAESPSRPQQPQSSSSSSSQAPMKRKLVRGRALSCLADRGGQPNPTKHPPAASDPTHTTNINTPTPTTPTTHSPSCGATRPCWSTTPS